ncbi:MAG: transcriptional repressor [Chloroflexi bacterium]|nr:transcriptional repressor [Chloroflexota bacterium]
MTPNNNPLAAQLADSLHAARRRLTPQRALILSILRESDEHLDAEGICALAHRRHSGLNLATVYRTLAVLKEMGLVEQRYFARDHKREYYEAVGKREHYHFTCLGCGKVIEVETPRIRQAQRELGEALGLVFAHACVCFEGYCAECARKHQAVEGGEAQANNA